MNMYRDRVMLVEKLKIEGIIKSELVEEAFLSVPREYFVPDHLKVYAYSDTPLPIGYGQTISAPHMVAIMTEELHVEPGDKVLEIGTGSGYQAAILAHIVSKQPGGHVYTIERIPQLASRAVVNIANARPDLLDFITVIVGDGSKGVELFQPYDKIIVTAAAPRIPEPLLQQLRPGGVMVIPVGNRWEQILQIVIKDRKGSIRIRDSISCIFVPLVGQYGWYNEYDYM
ncbi:MAG: protein-L-isoaspartate(D-aspartate) O-methyltransferase [Ignisphaera sp.]|uniref:Protein-L-isoaspartate O-methyltransferase n=1 Tax=Ignisphaera aggregans TaxID=334771 RepID=A0A7J3I6G7_9CREN